MKKVITAVALVSLVGAVAFASIESRTNIKQQQKQKQEQKETKKKECKHTCPFS